MTPTDAQVALPELPEWNGEFMTESEFAEAAQAYALEAVRMNQPASGEAVEMSPEFTDTARAALAWVLWHHQGGSSPVGQPIRFALGMGAHDPLPDWRITEAVRYANLFGWTTDDFHRTTPPAAQVEQEADVEAVAEVGPGWTLRLVGATPIAELFRRHPELRIGTKLYTHPAAQAPAVRVADEMANLRSAIMRLDGQSRRDTLVAYRKLEAALGQGRGS